MDTLLGVLPRSLFRLCAHPLATRNTSCVGSELRLLLRFALVSRELPHPKLHPLQGEAGAADDRLI